MKIEVIVEDLLGNLYKQLTLQIEKYKEMLALLQKEREAMVIMDIASMETIAAEKTGVLILVKKHEKEREKTVEILKELLGRKGQKITLLQLAESIQEPYSSKLRHAHSLLKALFSSITEINSINYSLARTSLNALNQRINFLKNNDSRRTYVNSGNIKEKNKSGNFIKMEL